MRSGLLEAALKGSVASLLELLHEDPLVLDRNIASCVSETPLHVAATLGHLDFVTTLLSHKPELAFELDSTGSSPLHLASAKGHLEIVKQLLMADPRMCHVRNQDGLTPLHVAAIKGRVAVLIELVRCVPESIQALTDRSETVIHLLVKHNRVDALKWLVELVGKYDDGLINWRDGDGYTVLHVAVARKRIVMVNILLTTVGVEVNALSKNGATTLDILTESPRDLRDMEIEDSLRAAGALNSKELNSISHDWTPRKVPQITKSITNGSKKNTAVIKKKPADWLNRKRSALMVVASLIATVAFQASLTPPGGVWQDDLLEPTNGQKPHMAGTAIMAYNQAREYGTFMIFNSMAFLSSLSIILLLVSGLPLNRRRWMWVQMVIMWIAVMALVVTYFLSLRHMSPKNVEGMLREVTQISVLAWLGVMGTVFIGNVIRMNLWLLRKYGCIEPKETVPSDSIEDDEDDDDGEAI